MTDECLFCRIAKGDVPAQTVASNSECVAFRDINPQAPVHILIIPRKHFSSLDDVSDDLLIGKMTMLAVALARQEGIAQTGYRTVINTGSDGGQSVGHLHLHLLGGRALAWPPG